MIVTTFRKITGNIYQENKHINVMATKSSKRNDSEVSDKLREIKQMQSNWMHQRAKIKEYGEDSSVPRETKARTKSLKKTEDTSNKSKNAKKESDPCVWIVGSGQKKTKTSSLRTRSASPVSRHSSSSGSTGSISRGPSRTNSGKPPTPKTASGNARLKKKSLNNDIEDTHVAQQTHMKQNSDFDVVETVTRTAAEVPDDHRTIHSVKTELSDIKEKLATRDSQGLMAPDMFDKLADQIANRVKAELEHEREQELYTRPTRTVAAVEDDVMASHRCEKCKQLMVPPDHTPTLLIPCGHTLCEACAEDRIKCPTCRTKGELVV
ncbi:uncharacterized protein LOC102803181 [Saccoglossus kowalevskii]|uniref:Uncharacterized protein LOC102803181 n=1 Tax=Saccoglossus kowalevskii TaxID=10224 RepID=A0ABM0M326_SACKO|nr:PREDICTED: uncharacterized protein LOC102803181 [Saccoglossus kowalevskii]